MKWFKRAVIALTTLAALIIIAILATGWFVAPQDTLEKADAIIVVSGGNTAARTATGVTLWKENWAPKLIFAGAAADGGTSNAAVMRRLAVSQGVPPDTTFIEERSGTTRENAEFLKPVLAAQDVRTAILVSSPYHTRRLKVTFERVYGNSVHFLVYPAPDARWSRSSWWKNSDTTRLTLSEAGKTFYTAVLQQ
jgi:uncharacterized SAM-binding protein YcdF (DUF218 family)